jgi:SAM-dependent methyltransferase
MTSPHHPRPQSSVSLWRALVGRPEGPPDRLRPDEEAAVAAAVHKLSQGFGGTRNAAGRGYLDDPDRLGAYLLFYAPVSRAQFRRVADRVGLRGGPGARALDLGSGPGPLVTVLRELGFDEIWAGDHSAEALRVLTRIHGPEVRTRVWDAEVDPLPEGRFHAITVGHALNEWWKRDADRVSRRAELLRRLADRLLPGGRLLVLEPARHVVNDELLAVRDALAADGPPILGPCFTRAPCPARAAGQPCHDALVWDPPEGLVRLAWRAHLDKSSLAFSWLALGSPADTAYVPDGAVRLVSERMKNKAGRERFLVCGPDGRVALSAPRTWGDAPWGPVWRRLDRGDAVCVLRPEARDSGLGLAPETQLLPLDPARNEA